MLFSIRRTLACAQILALLAATPGCEAFAGAAGEYRTPEPNPASSGRLVAGKAPTGLPQPAAPSSLPPSPASAGGASPKVAASPDSSQAAQRSLPQAGQPTAASAPEPALEARLAQTADGLGKALPADTSGLRAEELARLLYENEAAQTAASPSVPGTAGDSGSVGLNAADESSAGKLSSPAVPLPTRKPTSSVARSFRVGWFGAIVPLTVSIVAVMLALHYGHQLRPSYQGPTAGRTPTVAQAAEVLAMGAVFAPIAEETIFRAGVMGGLSALTRRLGKVPSFLIASVLSSALFVVIHEHKDPVLLATRFIHAMVLASVYKREGMTASIMAHGLFNALPMSLMLVNVALGPLGTVVFLLLLFPAGLGVSGWAGWGLWNQRGDRKAGRVEPYLLTRRNAAFLSPLLAAAAAFLLHYEPDWDGAIVVWTTASLGLAAYASGLPAWVWRRISRLWKRG